MTPEKQKQFDAFMAGAEAVKLLPDVEPEYKRLLMRGRFEEWLDDYDQRKARPEISEIARLRR